MRFAGNQNISMPFQVKFQKKAEEFYFKIALKYASKNNLKKIKKF